MSVLFHFEGVAFGAGAAVNGWAAAADRNGAERTGLVVVVVIGAIDDTALNVAVAVLFIQDKNLLPEV